MAWRPGMRVAFGIALLWGRVASAQTETDGAASERYSLSWVRGEGAQACPARGDLAAEVSKRLGRVPFDETAARSIEIQVDRGERGFESLTRVRDTDGSVVGRRELVSEEASCEPIFSATALAVALLIDPDAAQSRAANASPSVGSFDVGSVAALPAPAPEARREDVAAPQIEPERAASAPEPALSSRLPHPAGVGVEGVMAAGLIPEVGPGASLVVSYRPGLRFGLAASALYLESSNATRSGADFDVGLTAFALSGTFDLLPESFVRWTLEAGPMVGALHVSVRSPTPIDPGDFAFVALSGGSRLQIPLGSWAFASLRAAAVVNLVRRGLFVKGEEAPVFREPPVGALFGAGLGLSFF